MTARDTRPRLHIDIETYSDVDLPSAGVYKYAESPAFEMLLIAYAMDGGPVQVIDLKDGALWESHLDEQELLRQLLSPEVVKVAHNCSFERACLQRHYGVYLPPEQWEDTQALASYHGLPLALGQVAEALHLPQQKMREGAALIRYFCLPCKPTKANGGRSRNLPEHAPDKWATFVAYNLQDVQTERAIYDRLRGYQVTPMERAIFCTDARINERGVLIDRQLAEAAVRIDDDERGENQAELQALTGLENPNSVAQLKDWLQQQGCEVGSLSKATIGDTISTCGSPLVERVLHLRQLLGKTSTAKYKAMLEAANADDRVRGLTKYAGATRTGRWAGRIVQLQNLPQNHLADIEQVRELARRGDRAALGLCFDSVADTLSQLIRTAFIARPGCTLLVADYAAIEARVIAYLSGCQWRLQAFEAGQDIYCASASAMFGVPVVKHGTNGHLRQKGKIAELACGYGGNVGAMLNMGGAAMGLTEDEMRGIVQQWRAASPEIPKFWRDTEDAALHALRDPGRVYGLPCGVKYRRDADALRCRLPSGRVLSYWGAFEDDDGKLRFYAMEQATHRWGLSESWGGKLVENIVQAYARDLLGEALVRLERAGFDVVFHVHDEVIVEAPEGSRWEDVASIMAEPVSWAPGLPLRADGYSTKFYRKD